MHVMGPSSAAGSAFNMIGVIPVSTWDVRTRNTAVRRYSRGTAFFTLVKSRRGGRHRHDGHDEATRWWFGQAGRQQPSRAHCGLSATSGTPSQRGREATPSAVHWSVRERSNGCQGVPEMLGRHLHGATRWQRVAVSRRQVQRTAPVVVAVCGMPAPCVCRFRTGIPDRHNTRIVPGETDASGCGKGGM